MSSSNRRGRRERPMRVISSFSISSSFVILVSSCAANGLVSSCHRSHRASFIEQDDFKHLAHRSKWTAASTRDSTFSAHFYCMHLFPELIAFDGASCYTPFAPKLRLWWESTLSPDKSTASLSSPDPALRARMRARARPRDNAELSDDLPPHQQQDGDAPRPFFQTSICRAQVRLLAEQGLQWRQDAELSLAF